MRELLDGRFVLSDEASYAIIWVSTTTAVITTSLRLYARKFIVKALGLDDLLILCSLIACLAVSALLHWHIYLIWDLYNTMRGQFLTIDQDLLLSKMNLPCRSAAITDNSYVLVLPIAKCSILAFYRRISPSKKHHYLLYAFGFAIILQAILNVLLRTFAFDPPSAWWNCYSEGIKVRYNFKSLLPVNSSFQALFDIIILAIPLPVIYRMKLNRRRRVGLLMIYLLSFLSLGATLAQLVNVAQNTETGNEVDPLEVMEHRIEYTCWAIVEVTTVIICSNLPTMPVLFHNVKPLFRKIYLYSLSTHHDKGTAETTERSPPVSSPRWFHGVITSWVRHPLSFSKNVSYSDDTSKLRSDMTPSKEGRSVTNITIAKRTSIEMESVVIGSTEGYDSKV